MASEILSWSKATTYQHIWREEICPITEQEEEVKLENGTKVIKLIQRTKIRNLVEPLIQKHISDYKKAMAEILSK